MSHSRYFVNPWLTKKLDSSEFLKNKAVQEAWDVVNLVFAREPPQPSKGDGGLYVGIGGIAYMCYHVARSPICQGNKPLLLQKGIEYINAALQFLEQNRGRRRDQCGFLLGATGIYAVAAALHHMAGDGQSANKYSQLYSILAHTCLAKDFLPCGSDELFVGRAGYVYGALWLRKILGQVVVPDQEILNLCRAMWDSGKSYSERARSQSPLMYAYYDTEYLGAAHGLCFILQVLMTTPGFFQAYPEAERDVRGSLDYLLSVQSPEGDFPCTTDEAPLRHSESALVHWCHGAPGVVYTMAKAYLVWRDEKYLQSCIKCGEAVWKRGLLKKGPGICHGVAGNGYVFLLLYRLTNDSMYLYRAQKFAAFLQTEEFKRGARTPDSPFSLYEGLAGTACFLTDLLVPHEAIFPFSDVFLDQ